MALIKSTILSAIRGSINGTTFSQNKAGAYARNRSLVTNPNTAAQVNARTSFSGESAAWRELSAIAQDSWRLYAAGTPVTNRLGDTIYLSGMNMFMKTNGFRAVIALPRVNVAPTLLGLAQQPVFDGQPIIFDGNGTTPNEVGAWNYAAGVGSVNAGAVYAAWISNQVSLGTNFYKGPWNFIGTKAGNARETGTLNVPFEVVEDGAYYIRLRVLDELGRLAAPQIIGPIVAVTGI